MVHKREVLNFKSVEMEHSIFFRTQFPVREFIKGLNKVLHRSFKGKVK